MGRELVPEDIRVGVAYEAVRGNERARLADQQRLRRVAVGDVLSLVFENRASLSAALEEMLRTERTTDPERVAAGITAFNALVPADGVMGATLYVDVADPAELAATIAELDGVERSVHLEVGGASVAGVPDEAEPEEAAGAWHIRFTLDDAHRGAWRGATEVAVGVEHPARRARVVLTEEQRRAIGADL